MKVSECMSRDVRVTAPEATLQEAARAMAEWDTGALPVADNERLVGMVTDRDLVIRGLAQGKGPTSHVADVLTADVHFCNEDDDIGEVLEMMGRLQVRRLPVLDQKHQLVGIVSLGDLTHEEREAGEALADISRPASRTPHAPN